MTAITEPTDPDTRRKLIEQVTKRLSFLTAGEVYTLAAILGEDFWEDDGESHKSLGLCFSRLVNNELLPFASIGLTPDRHNKYRYNGTN
jgi:hypothetical protein